MKKIIQFLNTHSYLKEYGMKVAPKLLIRGFKEDDVIDLLKGRFDKSPSLKNFCERNKLPFNIIKQIIKNGTTD